MESIRAPFSPDVDRARGLVLGGYADRERFERGEVDVGTQRAVGARDSIAEAGIERFAMECAAVGAEQIVVHAASLRLSNATWVASCIMHDGHRGFRAYFGDYNEVINPHPAIAETSPIQRVLESDRVGSTLGDR